MYSTWNKLKCKPLKKKNKNIMLTNNGKNIMLSYDTINDKVWVLLKDWWTYYHFIRIYFKTSSSWLGRKIHLRMGK